MILIIVDIVLLVSVTVNMFLPIRSQLTISRIDLFVDLALLIHIALQFVSIIIFKIANKTPTF